MTDLLDYTRLRTHAFGLCDRLQASTAPEGIALTPLVPAALQKSARLMPALADLTRLKPAEHVALLSQLNVQAARADPLSLCALLQSRVAVDQVSAHLRRSLIAQAPGGQVYFRFFDPRVLVQLQWLLSAPQLTALMGPIDAWTYYLDGQWHTLVRPDVPAALRWRPDARQWFAMEHMLAINLLIGRLAPSSVHQRQEQGQAILALFSRAHAAGLRARADLEAFALHGLTIHPRFDDHPLIRALLASLAQDADYPYQDACADLEDSDWARVRHELNSPAEVS